MINIYEETRRGIFIFGVFLVMAGLIILTVSYATKAGNDDTGRFYLAEDCGTMHVYTDLKTGVQYLVTDAGGACALVQQDGEPWTADDWGGAEDAGA